MKSFGLSATTFVFCLAAAYGEGKDALTGLPVIPAAETVVAGKSYGFEPTDMPDSAVCRSKMKGDFYALGDMNVKDKNLTVNAAIAWYAAHLSGFKKARGSMSAGRQNSGSRSQTALYNSDGTIVIFITGNVAPQGQDAGVYSIAYQRYSPGLSEKTITSMTQGNIDCR